MPELTHAEAATRLDPTYPDAAVSYVEALGNVCASQAPDVRLYLRPTAIPWPKGLVVSIFSC